MLNSTHRISEQAERCATACVILVLLFAFSAAAFGQQHAVHLVVRQTATQSLTLIKPSDQGFESTLDTYYPGLSQEDGFQQAIKPFLVLVRNDNSLPALAYAITWTPRSADGWASPLRAVFVDRPLMYGGARITLNPEDIRLISPLFNVTPERYANTPSFAQVYSAARFPALDGKVTPIAQVDGVVYSDGSFIGSDTTKVLQRYMTAQFAARDEALAVLSSIQSSTVSPLLGVQLLQSLNQEAQETWRVNQGTLLAWYVRARGESARDVRRILRNGGVSGLQTKLQAYVDRSGYGDKPSFLDEPYRKLASSDPRVFGPVPWMPGQP